MPLCVNRTFFTAWFLTSATAGGVNPSASPPRSCSDAVYISNRPCTEHDVHANKTEAAKSEHFAKFTTLTSRIQLFRERIQSFVS